MTYKIAPREIGIVPSEDDTWLYSHIKCEDPRPKNEVIPEIPTYNAEKNTYFDPDLDLSMTPVSYANEVNIQMLTSK